MLQLFKKILPKKKESKPLSERDLNGRNHVGYPTMQVSREIDEIIKKHYKTIKPLINMYKETLFFKWMPSVINSNLSDEQLANLSGRNVQMVYLLLFRDMLRHVSAYVTPRNAPSNWTELLAQEVLDNCNMLGDTDDKDVPQKKILFAENDVYRIDSPTDEENPEKTVIPDWVVPISALIILPPDIIYKCHRSLMTVILKKLKKNK